MEVKDGQKVKTTERQEEEKNDKEQQEIWSWGAGTDGQLGTGRLQDELFPQFFHLPSAAAVGLISRLSCGGAHVLALTSDGKVLSWGRGGSGQLGHGDFVNNTKIPKLVIFPEPLFITHLSAGWNHSGFVSDSGSVFTCGDGSFGQLGHGDHESHCSPVKVSYFINNVVLQIACGMRHSIVLSNELEVLGSNPLLNTYYTDQVYAFGSGKRGQLGISKDKISSVNVRQVTSGLEGVKIIRVLANGDHSAALSTNGGLYTWGREFRGNSDSHCPTNLATSRRFTDAAFGWNHALLLTADGEVLMLGGKHHGVLSDPDKLSSSKHSLEPKEGVLQEVPAPEGRKVVDIAAGAEHSAVVTEDGAIWTWGWGEHGQLGLGDTCDQINPREVRLSGKLPSEGCDTKVYCGSGFTIAIKTPIVGSSTDEV